MLHHQNPRRLLCPQSHGGLHQPESPSVPNPRPTHASLWSGALTGMTNLCGPEEVGTTSINIHTNFYTHLTLIHTNLTSLQQTLGLRTCPPNTRSLGPGHAERQALGEQRL